MTSRTRCNIRTARPSYINGGIDLNFTRLTRVKNTQEEVTMLTSWKDKFGGVPNPKWVLLVSEEKGTLVSCSVKLSESGGVMRRGCQVLYGCFKVRVLPDYNKWL
jgi:hypothetical protein